MDILLRCSFDLLEKIKSAKGKVIAELVIAVVALGLALGFMQSFFTSTFLMVVWIILLVVLALVIVSTVLSLIAYGKLEYVNPEVTITPDNVIGHNEYGDKFNFKIENIVNVTINPRPKLYSKFTKVKGCMLYIESSSGSNVSVLLEDAEVVANKIIKMKKKR